MEEIRRHIQELERRLGDAMRNSDLDELEVLLADNLVFTDHLGNLWSKRDDLAAHRSGSIRVRSVEASDEQIHLFKEIAVVNIRLTISGNFGGQDASGKFQFTRVWMETQDGRWQVVAGHSTQVTDDVRN